MRRACSSFLLLSGLLALSLSMAVPATAAGKPAIGAHHLPANPNSPAFVFGFRGGFSNGGTFKATIYADGHLKLQKSSGGTFHLQNPTLRLSVDGLRGLLKLAEAEKFFSSPSQIIGKGAHADESTLFITVTSAEGTKSVSVLGVTVPSFNELYSVLNYTAGVAR